MANTTTRTWMAGLTMTAALMGMGRPAAAAFPRVRSGSAAIRASIQRASVRSHTFRRLVDTINASDGIVYVEEGICGRAVWACFTSVTASGSNRILLVKIETAKKTDRDVMGAIGHELRHTIEVL